MTGLTTTAAPAATQSAVNLLSAQSPLSASGVLGSGLVLFAATGLLISFFLPGDSLLFTAGPPATRTAPGGPRFSLTPLLLVAAAGTLGGSQGGCLIGRKAGGALLHRSHSAGPHQGARRAEEPLERYGHTQAIAALIASLALVPLAAELHRSRRTKAKEAHG